MSFDILFFFSFLTSDRLFARGATHRSTLQLGRFFYISFFPNMRVLCIDVGTLWLVIYKMSVNNKRYGTRKPPRKEKRIDVFCVGEPQKKISCWEFDIPPEPMALFFFWYPTTFEQHFCLPSKYFSLVQNEEGENRESQFFPCLDVTKGKRRLCFGASVPLCDLLLS